MLNPDDIANTIQPGDCLELLRQLPADCIDAVITDPPYYNVLREDWDRQWADMAAFQSWVEEVAVELARVLKPAGSLLWFCDSYVAAYVQTVLDRHFHFLNHLVWQKSNAQTLKGYAVYRSFTNTTERCLFYEQQSAPGLAATGLQQIYSAPECFGPVKEFLRAVKAELMARHGLTTLKQLGEYFASLGIPTTWTHWFGDSQFAIPTEDNWRRLQEANPGPPPPGFVVPSPLRQSYEGLRQSYEGLRQSYEGLRLSYEDLRKSYEDLRRPFHPLRDSHEVLTFPLHSGEFIHPAQKPLPLMAYLVERTTRPGDYVLDPFAGSGTTAHACHVTGRRWLTFERDPAHFAAARSRLDAVTRQPLLL